MGKTAQRRWFVLDSARSRLYYCKAPNSSECRGFIDLTTASVSFEDVKPEAASSSSGGSAAEIPAHFTIIAFDTNRGFELMAESREAMMAWIERIQQSRAYVATVHGPNNPPPPLAPGESPTQPGPMPKLNMDKAVTIGGDMRQAKLLNRWTKGVVNGMMMPITMPMHLIQHGVEATMAIVTPQSTTVVVDSSAANTAAPTAAPAGLGHAASVDSLPGNGDDEADSDTYEGHASNASNLFGLGKLMRLPTLKLPPLSRTKEEDASGGEGAAGTPEERYLETMKMQLAELSSKLSDAQDQIHMLREQSTLKDAMIRYTNAEDDAAKAQLFADQSETIKKLQEELVQARHEAKELREKQAHLKRAFLESTTKRDEDASKTAEAKAKVRELEARVQQLQQQGGPSGASVSVKRAPSEGNLAALPLPLSSVSSSQPDLVQALQNEVKNLTHVQQNEAKSKLDVANRLKTAQNQLQTLWTKHLELLAYLTELNIKDDKLKAMISAAKEVRLDSLPVSNRDPRLPGQGPETVYNKYGFRVDIDPQSQLILLKLDEGVAEQEAAWAEYLHSRGSQGFSRQDPRLKKLIRGGIPDRYRGEIWREMIKDLVGQQMKFQGQDFYKKLLEQQDGKTSVSTKQIELDLMRTFPTHRDYCKEESPSISKLRRVLIAYSWHQKDVGYCQGMNMIAAALLLFVDEETAFWGLITIVEHLLPKQYFTQTMLGVQVDQRVLKDLVAERLPKVNAHLDRNNIDISLVSFNFFLTLSVDSVPIDTALRIFDSFLFEGDKILFRFALAMLKMHETAILAVTDKMELFSYLKGMPKRLYDVTELFRNAFQVLNSFQGFSKRVIEDKRAHYRPLLEKEMREMQELREAEARKRGGGSRAVIDDDF